MSIIQLKYITIVIMITTLNIVIYIVEKREIIHVFLTFFFSIRIFITVIAG